MTVAEILAIIDLHGFEDSETADKVAIINDVLQEITTREPWPFLEYEFTITGNEIAADGLVTIPATPIFDSVLSIFDTVNGYKLEWIRREEHYQRNATQLTYPGNPGYYFFVGTALYVWPVPVGTGGSWRVTALQDQKVITSASVASDILLPAKHHRLIALGAIAKFHAQEDDPENASLFESQFDKKLMLMRQDLFKQQWDSPDSIQVLDEDDYGYES